jgi:hypothetical protein
MVEAIATTECLDGEYQPSASQIVADVVRLVTVPSLQAYLERKGWELKKNSSDTSLQMYTLPDPEEPDRPFVVELPLNPTWHGFKERMQEALERLATIEGTSFISLLCRVLQVERIILVPEQNGG